MAQSNMSNNTAGVHESSKMKLYNGADGFITSEQLVERTEAGVKAYAKDQPLKFRQAALGFSKFIPAFPPHRGRKRRGPVPVRQTGDQ